MGPLLRVPRHPLALARFGLPTVLPASAFARLFATEAGRALFGGVAAHAFRSLHHPPTSAIGLGIITRRAGRRPFCAGTPGTSWRDLHVPQPLGHLRHRQPTGDQELLGDLLADLVQQAAEGHPLLGEPAAQRPVAHVQRGRDLVEARRGARARHELLSDLPGEPGPGLSAGEQLAALLPGDRVGVLVGLGQRQIQDRRVEPTAFSPAPKVGVTPEDLAVALGVGGRRGERMKAKVRSRYRRPMSIALRQLGLLIIAKPQMP